MKIYIFGPSGSGKSTLGKLVQNKLGYKFIDLDKLLFGTNDISEREKIINNLLVKLKDENVVFEGIFRQSWLNNILKECNVIIILQIPSWKIKLRLLGRTLNRMIGIEKSKFKSNFFTYIELWKFTDRYKSENREEEFIDRVLKLGKENSLVYLRSNKEIEYYLHTLIGKI